MRELLTFQEYVFSLIELNSTKNSRAIAKVECELSQNCRTKKKLGLALRLLCDYNCSKYVSKKSRRESKLELVPQQQTRRHARSVVALAQGSRLVLTFVRAF